MTLSSSPRAGVETAYQVNVCVCCLRLRLESEVTTGQPDRLEQARHLSLALVSPALRQTVGVRTTVQDKFLILESRAAL